MGGGNHSQVSFFTICDRSFFPGLVGLINSLRIAGHHEPLTVLDRGMSKRQRKVVEDHCNVVSLDHEVTNPSQLTAFPSQLSTTGVIVLIDSDCLVLRRLDEAIEHAREGRICMFRDPHDERFFSEWSEIFNLQAPLRRQDYFNAGFVALSVDQWPNLLERWWESLRKIWDRPTFMEGASMRGDPTSQADQDALNALLMSEIPRGAVYELPVPKQAMSGRLQEVVIEDLDQLTCTWRGEDVHIVHATGRPKPWMVDCVRERRDTYCSLPLLRRVLTGDDATITLPRTLVVPWLWPGRIGDIAHSLVVGLVHTKR